MSIKTNISYKIGHGTGYISGKNRQHSFDTLEEAVKEAREFKKNPLSHNKDMGIASVQYWKNQSYTIEKHTLTVETLIVV